MIPQLAWWQWAMLVLAFFIVPRLLRKIAVYESLGKVPRTRHEQSIVGKYGIALAALGAFLGLADMVIGTSRLYVGYTIFVGGLAFLASMYLWEPRRAAHGVAYGTYIVGAYATANIETLALSVAVTFIVSLVIVGCARWLYTDMVDFTSAALFGSASLALAVSGYVLYALAGVVVVTGATYLTKEGYVENALDRLNRVSVP